MTKKMVLFCVVLVGLIIVGFYFVATQNPYQTPSGEGEANFKNFVFLKVFYNELGNLCKTHKFRNPFPVEVVENMGMIAVIGGSEVLWRIDTKEMSPFQAIVAGKKAAREVFGRLKEKKKRTSWIMISAEN